MVDRFFPLSKRCSACGHIHHKFTLTDRTYLCQPCGMVKDRDLNAAENLHRVGLARIQACGHDGSVSRFSVTEANSLDEAGRQRGAMITIAHSSQSRKTT